jgi:phosphoribosylformylglycinamidine synthase subunit PurQ / glutaminase
VSLEGPKVAVLSIEGTNCDEELLVGLRAVGACPELVHLKQFQGQEVERSLRRDLFDYQMLLLPGGFSAGDYVRAGAILAARIRATVGPQLEEFIRRGRLVGGICNGFQVLIELGLLPGRPDGRIGRAQAALLTNESGHFECRPSVVRWEGGRFAPLQTTPTGERYLFSVAHAEGRLVLADEPGARLPELEAMGQVLFRYATPDGGPVAYPWNPNGSVGNVAGLTTARGNVFGLMPHPERAVFRAQLPDWTRTGGADGFGDGYRFLEALVRHASAPA